MLTKLSSTAETRILKYQLANLKPVKSRIANDTWSTDVPQGVPELLKDTMPFCANPDCNHRQRLNKPAEFLPGITHCSDCGATLSETKPIFEAAQTPIEKSVEQTGWTCPQCSLINHHDGSHCLCGYDANRPTLRPADLPDYASYTLAELYDAHDHIDRERYPERFKLILEHLRMREAGLVPTVQKEQATENATAPEMKLAFTASASEYFGIWIVNLCLTLLTFGIFSAWAKVRKKRYFYSHITLDGTPFQYLGRPVPILKGRIVAALLFLSYYVSSHFVTSMFPYVLVAGTVLAPWMIVRSAAFNARYSAFRNMTFNFKATYLDAVKALYAWALIPVLLIGAMRNWWGSSKLLVVPVLAFGIAIPWLVKRFKGFIVEQTSFGGKPGVFTARGGQFLWLYAKAAGIVIAAIAVTAVLGATIVAAVKGSPASFKAFWLLIIPIYLGYAIAYAYYQAASANLVWNNTRLGPIAFRSTMSGGALAKLYFTNALAIIASAGLLIPWAVIRTVQYRVDHMQVMNTGDLAAFVGSEMTAVQAIGAETVDFFDMDISL